MTFEVDDEGQTTSYSLAGGARQTDVCAILASRDSASLRDHSVRSLRQTARDDHPGPSRVR